MIEIIVVIIAIIVWMVYEYMNAPFYDEETGKFYKKPKK